MPKTTYRTTPWMLSLLIGVLSAGANQPARAVTPWVTGDVFAGVSNGTYQVYDNTGVFKEAISDGLDGLTTGCAFNPSLTRLYTTNFRRAKVFVYDDPNPHPVSQIIDTGLTSPGGRSESVVFDAAGSFYVGHADGNQLLHKYDAAGNLLMTFSPQIERRGTVWNDLAADQRTMFYASGGGLIKRFDVGSNVQLPDFASIGRRSFALRLLLPADGRAGLIVANVLDIKRLDGSGTVVQTYDVRGEDRWFSMSLDPNRTSFWAGSTFNFYRFNLVTGAIEVGPINTGTGLLGGPSPRPPARSLALACHVGRGLPNEYVGVVLQDVMNGKGKRLHINVRSVLATGLEVIPESLEVPADLVLLINFNVRQNVSTHRG